MSYMKEVAKILGVELGERFRLYGLIHPLYYLEEDGLKAVGQVGRFDDVLGKIMCGYKHIVKIPWTPKEGERYWAIGTKGKPSQLSYSNDFLIDILNVRLGNCFKTEEEAKENADNFLKYIKCEPDFSWRVQK